VNTVADLVTGEAVVVDLRIARLASRGLAFALDVGVQLVALVILLLVIRPWSGPDRALAAATTLIVVIAVLAGYPVTIETLTRGRSLGKLAFGLRVVRDDGGPIRFRHALVRGLAGVFVDFWALGLLGFVAVLVSLSSAKGKRICPGCPTSSRSPPVSTSAGCTTSTCPRPTSSAPAWPRT
jgi:uncharacterized RDD family membrane protein YckC